MRVNRDFDAHGPVKTSTSSTANCDAAGCGAAAFRHPTEMHRLFRFTATCSAAVTVASCTADQRPPLTSEPPPPLTVPHVDRIVLVSVDGLRGDALRHMPRVSALLDRALWTDSMSTIVPSLTVPGHLAMFTGRDVSEFGITNNAFDNSAAATLILNNATSIFAWAHDAGMSSIALAGLSLIPPSDVAAAREFFELDSLIPVDRLVDPIIDRAIGIATRPNAPNVLFVHVPTTDFAGHDDGWTRADTLDELGHEVPTSGYVSAVASVDAALGRLWAAVSAEIATGAVALIITADHGGGDGNGCVSGVPEEREHCTGEPGDRLIPFMLLTRDVAPARLGAVASITQIAPTAAALLQLTRPASTDPSLLR